MNKIVEIKFGSHLYGCETPNSDLDFKGIYLPTAREIVLHNYGKTITTTRPKQPFERNTKDDVDVEILSLDQFLKLLLEGQTMALDMLFAPPEMWVDWGNGDNIHIFIEIYQNRHHLLNRRLNSFVGYARQQAAKYGQKGFRVHAYRSTLEWLKSFPDEYERIGTLGRNVIQDWIDSIDNENIKIVDHPAPGGNLIPHIDVCGKLIPFTTTFKHTKTWLQKYVEMYGQRALMAERNEGVDWKALSHAVRVNSEAKELLETGSITFPRPDREVLLKIKTGQMEYKVVAEMIETGLEDLKAAEERSILRDEPNRKWAEDYLYDLYSGIVKGA